MSSATVTKFKWFWHDQDVEQEQWLRAMALRGLHLKALSFLFWTFEKGQSADVVYRVDFNNESVKPAYRQLLEDAGWELAAVEHGWQYWRTTKSQGAGAELFTDTASKMAKFRRLLALMIACAFPLLLAFTQAGKNKMFEQLSPPFLIFLLAGAAVNVTAIVRLSARIWRMRREQS